MIVYHIIHRLAGNFFILFFVLVMVSVSAVSISVHPDEIETGDTVTIDIQGLANGSHFSLLLEGRFVPATDHFIFRTAHFIMPITLHEGQITAYTDNTTFTTISIQKGSTTITMSGESQNGIFETTEVHEVSEGAYDFMQIEGYRIQGASQVRTWLQLTGVTQGPDSSSLSFVVEGMEKGIVRVQIGIEGTTVIDQTLTVVASAPPSGTDHNEMTFIPVVPPSTTLIETTGTSFLRSEDGNVEIDTSVGITAIQPSERKTIGTGWRFVYSPYTVFPENLSFSSPVILSFLLLSEIENPVFLAVWENGDWKMLPSRIEGERISAEIHRSGTYGLMTLNGSATEESLPDTSVPVPSTLSLAPPLTIAGALLAFIMIGFRYKR